MESLTVALVLALFFSPFLGAYLLDRRHRQLRPEHRPFGWGYLNGLGGFLTPLFIAGQFGQTDPELGRIVLLVAVAIFWPLAILTLRRHGWGYVLLTVLSLNPVLWIINPSYIGNHWDEFTTERRGRNA